MKILAEKFEYFSKKIEKLSKKSKKILGKEISFEIKNSFIQEVKEGSNVLYVKMLDIEVEIPEIKIEGWTPMVAIDHTNENAIGIILSFFNMMMDKKFRLGKLV